MNTFHKIKRAGILALLVASMTTARTVQAALKVGDTLPGLTGFELEGKLPDALKGKVVLLDFWASWCKPCAESFPAMEELQKKFGDQGLAIVAVNVDEKASDKEMFLKKHPVSFTTVRDAKQKLVGTVSPETMPTSYILDRTGKVRFLHNGYHGEETKKQYISEIESLLKGTP